MQWEHRLPYTTSFPIITIYKIPLISAMIARSVHSLWCHAAHANLAKRIGQMTESDTFCSYASQRYWMEQGSFWWLDGCLSDSLLVNLELLLRVRYDVGFISLRANPGTYQCHCGDGPSSRLYCYSNISSKSNVLRAVVSSAQVSNEIVAQNSQSNNNTTKITL